MTERNTDFLEMGLTAYCEARRTIVQFETQIQDSARAALSRHQESLAEAIGKPFSGKQPVNYAKDDSPQVSWAWVAVYIGCERPLAWLYVGIRWELDSGGKPRAYAAVDFDAGSAPARDRLLTATAKVIPSPRFGLKNEWQNEVLMQIELEPIDAANLESILSDVLSEWERLFRAIGGVAALDPKP